MSRPMTTKESIRMEAMAIVNKILDLADIGVEKRQSINDACDDIIVDGLTKARIDENRRWADGERSIHAEDPLAFSSEEIQSIIRSIAEMHIANLKGEKEELPF